ncbi:MAG: metallophosphoesterase [bacterium]
MQIGRPDQRPNHANVLTFYALGDWGTGAEEQKAVAEALRKNVREIPENRIDPPFVLGLGDNVYEKGLPEGWNNPEATQLLRTTFGDIYRKIKYEGKELVFHIVPGNHDYNGTASGKKGWGDVIHQETTAEQLYFPYWKYYPIDQEKNSDRNDSTNYHALKKASIFSLTIPEKMNIESNQSVTFVALDTQVLLELYKRNDTRMLQNHWNKLESLLDADHAWKILVGHHPVKNHGRHGGFRTAAWWLPPIFLYTIIDKFLIKPLQDLDNPANRRFQEDLIKVMQKHDVKLYISGHEHNLQFLKIDAKHYQIISGSAAKLTEVTHKFDTIFSHAAFGFIRFDVANDVLWVEFFQVAENHDTYASTGLFKISK